MSPHLVACSLCLRVLRASEWIEADQAIRELRTFELPAPLRLQPGLCDLCAELVARRRANGVPERSISAAWRARVDLRAPWDVRRRVSGRTTTSRPGRPIVFRAHPPRAQHGD
jgi:hypothetical protein